ncbi:MAG TPA: type II toxin-antitoxin system Phd/YefM family antitoxin [Actinomycetota bacterium]|nr:type II toxin-antitoxin system Phd/YefM family antitoxin [Actinomycetota bacterium]
MAGGRGDLLVTLSEVRLRLSEVLRDLPNRSVLILRHGRPVAKLVHPDVYEALLNRIEDLEDRLSVYEAEKEPMDMRRSWEKVKGDPGA